MSADLGVPEYDDPRGWCTNRRCYPHDPVNRFFRSALFPLIVIVLLVYLASQTLIPTSDSRAEGHVLAAARQVDAGKVSEVEFSPSRLQITATLVGGDKVKVNYPSDQSRSSSRSCSEEGRHVRLEGHGRRPGGSLLILAAPVRCS